MTSDGWVKLLDESSHKFTYQDKRHKLPATCINFKHDSNGNVDYLLSGSADYTYNIIPVSSSITSALIYLILKLLFGFAILFAVIEFLI
jgi:hypothetical protein